MDSKDLLNQLTLAADIHVSRYTRHTKAGKAVQVKSYFRSPIQAMQELFSETRSAGQSQVSEQSMRVAVQKAAGRGPTRQELSEGRAAAAKAGLKVTNGPHVPAKPAPKPLTPAKDRKFGEASHDATDLLHTPKDATPKDGEKTTADAFDPAKSKVAELIRGKQKVPLGTKVGKGNPNPPADKGKGKGTPKDPIKVYGDLEMAVDLLAKGKSIRLETPREVSLLVDRVNDVVRDIQAKGLEAPDYDFCKISVPGTNLFCQENKGIGRTEMPQFSGVNAAGDKLDVTEGWQEMLDGAGIPTERKSVPVTELKATQAQLVGAKVAGMANILKEAAKNPEKLNPNTGRTFAADAAKIRAPIYTTSDGYIVDGHHRWAAVLVADGEDGILGNEQMSVKEIGMEIGATIDLAREYTKSAGIVPKGRDVGPSRAAASEAPKVEAPKPAPTPRVQRVEAGLDNAATRNARRAYADFDRVPDGRVIIPESVLRDFGPEHGPHSLSKYMETATDADGKEVTVLSREREALHDELVRRSVDGIKPAKEGKRRVMFLGGGSGAGKGTATKRIAGYPKVRELDKFGVEPAGEAVLVDPDAFKLALPDYDRMDDNAASFTHEESSLLAKQTTKAAQRLGLDVVQDGTGDGSVKKQTGKIREAQGNGYSANGVYVTVPTEVAMVRNLVRAIEIRRKVPLDTLTDIHKSVSTVADALKDTYDTFSLYDSDVEMGSDPHVIIENGIMRDQAKYDAFMAKTEQPYIEAIRAAIADAERRDFKTVKTWDGESIPPEEVRARVLFDLRNSLHEAELMEAQGLT